MMGQEVPKLFKCSGFLMVKKTLSKEEIDKLRKEYYKSYTGVEFKRFEGINAGWVVVGILIVLILLYAIFVKGWSG